MINFAGGEVVNRDKRARRVFAYANYFKDFKRTLSKETLSKIYQVILLIMTEEIIPTKYFRVIKGVKGLYEIRIEESGNIYRIFSCFDEGNLIILLNGFQKKSQKTPDREIEKAERIMNEYFSKRNKLHNNDR